MQINNFKLQVLNDFKSFYMLQKINGDDTSVFLHQETPEGKKEITSFQAYKMANNKVLIAFFEDTKISQDYNYVATSNGIEEIIPTQIYEKIIQTCRKPVSNNNGFFLFSNSLHITPDKEPSRCDLNKLGPTVFTKDNSYGEILFDDVSQLLIFEPIISFNGVGHILFAELKNNTELENKMINNWETPSSARTFSELLKLMIEWSETTEEPFNNTEPIAVAAKKFFETVGINQEIINHIKSNQVEMQVVNYLMGSENARVRPDGVLPLTVEIENWLLSKVCFITLSKLLEFYPDAWDRKEVLNKEKEVFNTRAINGFAEYKMTYYEDSLEDIDYCVETAAAFLNIPSSYRSFLISYFDLLKFKKQTLQDISLSLV
jgi:hypothetical protein